MDVNLVSNQMLYPNATSAANTQHNLNHAATLAQSFEAMEQKQRDELKRKQVLRKDEAEGKNISGQAEMQGRHMENRRGGTNSANSQERFAIDPLRGRRIDFGA